MKYRAIPYVSSWNAGWQIQERVLWFFWDTLAFVKTKKEAEELLSHLRGENL